MALRPCGGCFSFHITESFVQRYVQEAAGFLGTERERKERSDLVQFGKEEKHDQPSREMDDSREKQPRGGDEEGDSTTLQVFFYRIVADAKVVLMTDGSCQE